MTLHFSITKKNLLTFLATIVFIWLGITFVLYEIIENRSQQVIQHQIYHIGKNDTKEIDKCDFSSNLIKNALDRSKTEKCKQSLKDIFCFHLNEEIDLDNKCPDFDKQLYHKFIGCYNSTKSLLTGYQYKFEKTNTPDNCLQYCFRAGYELAGLHSGKNCYCGGINELKENNKVDKKNCETLSCSGNSNLTCGGYSFTAVYSTGLKELKRKMPKFNYLIDNKNEKEVKILFVLQLNGRNTRQVIRMLRGIYNEEHLYVIHVDERQDFMYFEMKALEKQLHKRKLFNLKVIEKRYRTIWGGSTLLTMFLDIVKTTLNDSKFNDWDYILNMSESDMPLLSLEELEYNLFLNKGKSFLASHGKNTADFIQSQGLYKAFHQCDDRMWRIKDRSIFPKYMRIDGGSDWVVIHRDLAIKGVDDSLLTKQLQHFFSSVLLPLESYFHTLGFNSEYCHQIISKNLRLTNWNRKQGCRCATLKKVVDWCGCSPLVFRIDDNRLKLEYVQQKTQFFGRKFDSLVSIIPFEGIEKNIYRYKPKIFEKIKNEVYNSTWINSFDRNSDFEDSKRYLYEGIGKILFLQWLNGQEFEPCGFDKLLKIWTYKENTNTKMFPILEVVDGCGSHFQLLLNRMNKTQINPDNSMEEFEIIDAEYGTNLDLKEEIFRDVLPVIDVNSKIEILFHWKRNDSYPIKKETSPLVNVQWWNTIGKLIKHELVKPYDSIYGGQYATLDLNNITLDNYIIPGLWTARLPSKDGDKPVFETQFPVFPSDRDTKLFEKLVKIFYQIKDACSIERITPKIKKCSESLWSSYYPDPKSQLFI